MRNHYVTFGQEHTHRINGKTIDCDTVVTYKAENAEEGRRRAFELFGTKFCFEYHDNKWQRGDIEYYPKGYVYL